MPRPKCHHCGRRVRSSDHSSVYDTTTNERKFFCSHKRACRIACHEECGNTQALARPISEAWGAALIAADFVALPWPANWLPVHIQDEVRHRLARDIAAAVEQCLAEQHVTSNLTTTEGN